MGYAYGVIYGSSRSVSDDPLPTILKDAAGERQLKATGLKILIKGVLVSHRSKKCLGILPGSQVT